MSQRKREPMASARGDACWFHTEKGLNNVGYMPSGPCASKDLLPTTIVSEAMCNLRWVPREGGSYRYARRGHSESPRQCYRIERLFQITHQRPIKKSRCFGLAFGRGLLAKVLGYAVDWALFAEKQCARGRSHLKLSKN